MGSNSNTLSGLNSGPTMGGGNGASFGGRHQF